MNIFDQISDYINNFFDTQVQRIPEVFKAPGYTYVLIGVIGLLYLIFGLKVYRFVLALIMLSIAAGVTFFYTEDYLIAGVVGLAAGLIAFLLQYIFVLLVAGLVFAGMVFIGLWAWLQRADWPLLAACAGIGLGIFLAVKLFKFIIIFSTSAIGAACVTGSFWILYQTCQTTGLTETMTGVVQFDPALFEGDEVTTGAIFGGLLLLGILVQAVILAFSRKPKAEAAQE
jgi:hypothetical protein